MSATYADVRHDCDKPDLPQVGDYGERHQTVARWSCPECRARWTLTATFLDRDRFWWTRQSNGSWRWRRAERRRLAAASSSSERP